MLFYACLCASIPIYGPICGLLGGFGCLLAWPGTCLVFVLSCPGLVCFLLVIPWKPDRTGFGLDWSLREKQLVAVLGVEVD